MIETPHAVAVVAVLCGVVLILTPVEGATEPRHAVAASPQTQQSPPLAPLKRDFLFLLPTTASLAGS